MTLFTVSRESWPGRLAVTSPLPQPQTVLTWELAAWHPTLPGTPRLSHRPQARAEPSQKEAAAGSERATHSSLQPRTPSPQSHSSPSSGTPLPPSRLALEHMGPHLGSQGEMWPGRPTLRSLQAGPAPAPRHPVLCSPRPHIATPHPPPLPHPGSLQTLGEHMRLALPKALSQLGPWTPSPQAAARSPWQALCPGEAPADRRWVPAGPADARASRGHRAGRDSGWRLRALAPGHHDLVGPSVRGPPSIPCPCAGVQSHRGHTWLSCR